MTPDQARQVIQEALTQVAPDADIAGLTPDAGQWPYTTPPMATTRSRSA